MTNLNNPSLPSNPTPLNHPPQNNENNQRSQTQTQIIIPKKNITPRCIVTLKGQNLLLEIKREIQIRKDAEKRQEIAFRNLRGQSVASNHPSSPLSPMRARKFNRTSNQKPSTSRFGNQRPPSLSRKRTIDNLDSRIKNMQSPTFKISPKPRRFSTFNTNNNNASKRKSILFKQRPKIYASMDSNIQGSMASNSKNLINKNGIIQTQFNSHNHVTSLNKIRSQSQNYSKLNLKDASILNKNRVIFQKGKILKRETPYLTRNFSGKSILKIKKPSYQSARSVYSGRRQDSMVSKSRIEGDIDLKVFQSSKREQLFEQLGFLSSDAEKRSKRWYKIRRLHQKGEKQYEVSKKRRYKEILELQKERSDLGELKNCSIQVSKDKRLIFELPIEERQKGKEDGKLQLGGGGTFSCYRLSTLESVCNEDNFEQDSVFAVPSYRKKKSSRQMNRSSTKKRKGKSKERSLFFLSTMRIDDKGGQGDLTSRLQYGEGIGKIVDGKGEREGGENDKIIQVGNGEVQNYKLLELM